MALRVLGGLWVLLAGLYMFWGFFTDGGLYGRLIRLQSNWLGGYSRTAALAFPWLVLSAPAVRYRRSVSGRTEVLPPQTLDARRRVAQRAASWCGAIGLAAAVATVGLWALGAGAPDESRSGYDVAAGLAGVMAFVFLVVALICAVQGPKLWPGADI